MYLLFNVLNGNVFKYLTGILTSFLIISSLPANVSAQGKSYPFNVSAWYKALSINKSDQDKADVNLTLFMTNIGSINTLNTGLGFTLVQNNFKGVNINAGVTSISGNSKGFMLSAIGNLHRGNIQGFEIGG